MQRLERCPFAFHFLVNDCPIRLRLAVKVDAQRRKQQILQLGIVEIGRERPGKASSHSPGQIVSHHIAAKPEAFRDTSPAGAGFEGKAQHLPNFAHGNSPVGHDDVRHTSRAAVSPGNTHPYPLAGGIQIGHWKQGEKAAGLDRPTGGIAKSV